MPERKPCSESPKVSSSATTRASCASRWAASLATRESASTTSELGLHGRTIGRWLRGAPNKAGATAPKRHFRRVTVTPERIEDTVLSAPSQAAELVVIVGTLRVEGLDLNGVVRLVRALSA